MKMHSAGRNTYKVIDLKALVDNYTKISSVTAESHTIAIIKADAYGHGAIKVAKKLENIVPAFAVGFIDEALCLRENTIDLPILLLEGPLSIEDVALAIKFNFWLMIHSEHQLAWLLKADAFASIQIWLKIDTGMGRLGFALENALVVIDELKAHGYKNIILCTHCSCADDINNIKTISQSNQLKKLATKNNFAISIANSAGILSWDVSHGDWNRLGLALYGGNPMNDNILPSSNVFQLTPVMTLQSSIIALRVLNKGDSVGYGDTWVAERKSTIATVAIGYADGYPRHAKEGTPVFIHETLMPLVGRVSMDMITIDVTDLVNIQIGDSVELWGRNLPVEMVAKHAGTISYELLTRVSARVKTIYEE